jgi:hypothetical protein
LADTGGTETASLGLAAAGPLSALVGTSGVLGFGAAWQFAAAVAVLTLPAIRVALPQHS